MNEKILLVEDDKNILINLTDMLESSGYHVITASTQAEAIEILEEVSFDLLLLDLNLTDGSGFTVCMSARKKGDVPVIFLTASSDEMSVVTGLDMGADDYVTKPFRPLELLSRIKSVLRRRGNSKGVVQLKNLMIDTEKGTVKKDGNEIFLSALEYRLLLVFINNRGSVLSRNTLLENIWDIAGEFVNDNTLTVYIKRLREKIEDDPQNPQFIKTIRGLGYKLGE